MDLVIALAEQLFKISWIDAGEVSDVFGKGVPPWRINIGGEDNEGVMHDYTGTGDTLIRALQDLVGQLSLKCDEKAKEGSQ